MLSDFDPMPTLAVSDLRRARDFYENVLGYQPQGEPAEGVTYKSGAGTFLVYPSAYAGTNKATAMSIPLPDDAFDREVQALRDKGVGFQTFELEGITWNDGVASMGDSARAVWFEDPDGNILNLEVGS